MSALRISRPGEPVQLVDLGPAVGRIIHSRGPVYGTVAIGIGPTPAISTTSPARRAQMKEYRQAMVEACGYVMPKLGEKCARRKGHSPENDHRSRRNLEDIARRRWATT